jgi:hypothetical protein
VLPIALVKTGQKVFGERQNVGAPLSRQRKFANLIEEDGPARSALELSQLAAHRSGKRLLSHVQTTRTPAIRQ